MAKSQKVVKKKFFLVKIPILKKEIELLGSDIKEFNGKTIKLDLTHDLKGRSLDLKLVVIVKEKEAVTEGIAPEKILDSLLEALPLKQAVSLTSKITGERKNVLYEIALAKKGKREI